MPHKLPGGQSQAAWHRRPDSADGLGLEDGGSCHVTPRAIFRGFTSSTWAPSRDGPGTSISQCYDKTSPHGPAAAHPSVTPGAGHPAAQTSLPRGRPPGCRRGRAPSESTGRCPSAHPVDLAAREPPLPALLLLGHTLRAGPRSLLLPLGPTAPHGPTWRAASSLPPVPSSRSTWPPGSPLPPREGLGPLTLPVCSFRPWGASAFPPPPTHSTRSTAAPPAKWPLWRPTQLSKLGNKPDAYLPATCLATFGASRKAGQEQRDSRGRVLSLSPGRRAPGQPGLTLHVHSDQPQSFPCREGRNCKKSQRT